MANLEINVREAKLPDGDALAGLMVCLGYSTTPEQMRARLARIAEERAYGTFVAVINGKTVGMIGACICPLYEADEPAGRIVALCVDPTARRSRTGTILVKHAEGWLSDQGAGMVLVNSGINRHDAHAFYEKLGYSTSGVRFKKQL